MREGLSERGLDGEKEREILPSQSTMKQNDNGILGRSNYKIILFLTRETELTYDTFYTVKYLLYGYQSISIEYNLKYRTIVDEKQKILNRIISERYHRARYHALSMGPYITYTSTPS